MKRPVRVLQVIGGLGVGGAETWLMELLRHWSGGDRVRTDFLLTGGRPEHFDREAKELGAELHYIQYGRGGMPRFIREFRSLLRSRGYDAIHDHADYAGGWRLLMGLPVLPPVRVAHVHNPWLHIKENYATSCSRRAAVRGGKWLVNRLATHVCGTSAEILRQYGFAPGSDGGPCVGVVHCGFQIDRFSAERDRDRARILEEFRWPGDSRLVLFVGRIDRALEFAHPQNHKNSWFALNVAKVALARDPRVRLVMAGDGPSREALQAQVQAWGLGGRLVMAGIRSDIPQLMRASDVLLFPSAQEGLGMAAVEAQAAGLPVLASTSVPLEAVVLPELYTALPLSSPLESWADALLEVAARPRPEIAECRRILEQSAFSIHESSRRLEAIYRFGT